MPKGGDVVSDVKSTQKQAMSYGFLVTSMHTATANKWEEEVKTRRKRKTTVKAPSTSTSIGLWLMFGDRVLYVQLTP